MPLYYGSEYVLCPFYQDETKNAIKCEGEFSATCVFNFFTAADKKLHKIKYCNKSYAECPHFKNVNQKYI